MFNNETHHDHFLTCIQTRVQKHRRIKSLSSTLPKFHTLPSLRVYTLNKVSNYYDDGLNNEDEFQKKNNMMNKSIVHQPPTKQQQKTTRTNKLNKTRIQYSHDEQSSSESPNNPDTPTRIKTRHLPPRYTDGSPHMVSSHTSSSISSASHS